MSRAHPPVRLKHEDISGELTQEIRSGGLPRGAQLPGEKALAQRFGVSRTTVRAALADLSAQGLIATRSGKGSFVLYDGLPLDVEGGWAQALAACGVPTTVRVLSVRGGTDEALAARLHLSSADVVYVDRVRETSTGQAISVERSALPAVGPLRDLPLRGLEGSLTAELERAGLREHHGEQLVSARPLSASEAAELGRAPGTWFLHTRRTALTASGELVEEVDSMLDPEHFEVALTFGPR
ncbi:MAG: GntR family transcriptional regulator [Cellulomonadaceae bacterium]|nr:GntR family transcriptional regulator [Cellulomonadaceae bacterium]